jgi:hypothetical protein
MSKKSDRIDALVAELAPVRDDELPAARGSSDAAALFATIVASPADTATENQFHPRRGRLLAFAAAVVLAAVLSIPAFGVGPEIVSLFAGWKDPEAPVPTASDVLIASGEAGVRWKIVATTSDHGLCLGLFYRAGGDTFGSDGCRYRNLRGDFPPDIRGDPATPCLGPPTANRPGGTLVPCGSLPRTWFEGSGAGNSVGLEDRFAFGALADGVASVEYVLTNGNRLHANIVERPGGLPLNFYWVMWPCPLRPVLTGPYAGEGLRMCAGDGGPDVEMTIVRDAAGQVLERRVPAWNGNPLGDPDGLPPPSSDGV